MVGQVEGQAGVAVAAGGMAAGVGPFAGEGLDEALGLAVGLGLVRALEDAPDDGSGACAIVAPGSPWHRRILSNYCRMGTSRCFCSVPVSSGDNIVSE